MDTQFIIDMGEVKYSQSIFKASYDSATVKASRKITFIIASEATTGRNHRNKFNYNWDRWELAGFNANPIVGYQHNVYGDNMCVAPNPDDVIAKASVGIDMFEGKRALVADTTFEPAELNATAEKVFQKILWGSLNATSTGVAALGNLETEYFKNEKKEVVDYQINFPGQELLEFSIVNIPADPKALRRSMKSHTMAALSFLQKSLPQLSMNEMMKMSVQDLLGIFEKSLVSDVIAEDGDSFNGSVKNLVEAEIVGGDPNVDKFINRLKTIQSNRKWTR